MDSRTGHDDAIGWIPQYRSKRGDLRSDLISEGKKTKDGISLKFFKELVQLEFDLSLALKRRDFQQANATQSDGFGSAHALVQDAALIAG